jgi:hypothetical protein
LLALGEACMSNGDYRSCHPAVGDVTLGANQLGKGALLFRTNLRVFTLFLSKLIYLIYLTTLFALHKLHHRVID